MIFKEIRTKKPYIFVFFQGRSRSSAPPPPSGSAHDSFIFNCAICDVLKCHCSNGAVIISYESVGGSFSCADPEGGGQGIRTLPEKSQKYRVSLQYWSGSPKSSMLGHSRHASETFRWRADDGPLIVVLGSSLPLQIKKYKIKRCQSWTPSDKTFRIRACFFYIILRSKLFIRTIQVRSPPPSGCMRWKGHGVRSPWKSTKL